MEKIKTLIVNAWSHEASKMIENPAVRQEIIRTFLAAPCCRSNHSTGQIPENGRYTVAGNKFQFVTVDVMDWQYLTQGDFLLGQYRDELYVVNAGDRQALIGYTIGGSPSSWGNHIIAKVGDILDLLNSSMPTPVKWRDYITGSKREVEKEIIKLLKPIDFGTFGDPTYTGWITKD